VPGALHVERNVLEWRFDPGGEARLPQATGYHQHVIVMCSQGYASSLAAASLQDIGLVNATTWPGASWPGPGPACPASLPRRRDDAPSDEAELGGGRAAGRGGAGAAAPVPGGRGGAE
jgi:rhodanese-related sulfurtransferase